MTRLASMVISLMVVSACAHSESATPRSAEVPDFLLGEFQDDYGGRHTVTRTDWHQQPRNRFHITRWNVREQFLIAQNDSANRDAGGRWTRIDWVRLDGMAPYMWAFCFSAYEAGSEAAATAVTIARRDTPRTGCNGYPFTRMRAVP